MPIIPSVGRKDLRIRLLVAALYSILTLGAVTMVYPFLLLLSTSITSNVDTNEFRVVPRYLYQEAPLFAKYVDDKYEGDIELVNAMHHTDFSKGENVVPPAGLGSAGSRALVADWRAFVRTLPPKFKRVGFRGYGNNPGQLKLAYRDEVRRVFNGDVEALNRAYTEENSRFDTVMLPLERPTSRNWSPDTSRKMQDFLAWKQRLPEEMLIVVGAEPIFQKYLKEDAADYVGDIKKAAQVWGAVTAFHEIPLPVTAPADPRQRKDWENFVRKKLPFRFLAPPPEAAWTYHAFLRRKHASIEKLNEAYRAHFADFDSVPLPTDLPNGGAIVTDWGEYVAQAMPIEVMRLDTPENRFRDYVAGKYGEAPAEPLAYRGGPDAPRLSAAQRRPSAAELARTMASEPAVDLGRVNAAYGLRLARLADLFPPYRLSDAAYVHDNAASLRRSYVTRNYGMVLDYILLHGRALAVTAVFCLAVIITTLLVNPMCAYALSRYSLPYAYKVLLFLLATMAFPAEVAMIPNFLLLKQLGLLNTYWALILPGMASGFSIFLLKGFFDSLPKEIYEAGTIDGASETRMFFNITLPLSKPIFAVIALNAFTAAYGAFMFALLVCQDQKMWTIMVWLYQWQISNPQYITMAALTVAALPTLLVFVFAQNVIMRGIILPSYK